MNCPNCNQDKLLPARTNGGSPAIDGKKCANCGSVYRGNDTNNLVPLVIGKVPGAPATAAPVEHRDKPSHSPIARGGRLSPDQQASVTRRLQAGDSPKLIAAEVGCSFQSVYKRAKKLNGTQPQSSLNMAKSSKTNRRHTGATGALAQKERETILYHLKAGEKPAVIAKTFNCSRTSIYRYQAQLIKIDPPPANSKMIFTPPQIGNIISQVLRVKHGEIKNAYPVMERYHKLLCYEKERAIALAKDREQKIKLVDDIMAGLKAVAEENKKTARKIAVLVGERG